MAIAKIDVRFFTYGVENDICACVNCGNTDNDGSDECPDCGGDMIEPEADIYEIDEDEFIELAKSEAITYERDTVFENGVAQIRLTVGLPQG